MIRRNITYKEKSLIIPLYKAIVRPHLEYCIQAWNPYLRKDVDMGDSLEKGTKSVTLLFCHHNLWRVSHDRNCLEFSLTSQNVIKFTIR